MPSWLLGRHSITEMVKWLTDPTQRFALRPFYENRELDQECENILVEFMKSRRTRLEPPISTNDLQIMIEQRADLDVYADLSNDGPNTEGKTIFYSDSRKPHILICESLQDPKRENRLRTTLTHEFSHVVFHRFLYSSKGGFLTSQSGALDTHIDPTNDWMEWQARYGCGAFLMPASHMTRLVRDFRREYGHNRHDVISLKTPSGMYLRNKVSQTFQVSEDAARMRLLKMNLAVE